MSKADIKRIAADVDPTGFMDAKEYLQAVYQTLKSKLERYSYVQYTEDLGFGACNAMYLIINGQRPLTPKGARKIATALGLTRVGRQYFIKLVEAQAGASTQDRDDAFDRLVELKSRALPTQLTRSQLDFFNDWYNAAILELLSLPESDDNAEWLGSRLMPTIAPGKVEKSLALLKRLGYLRFDEAKKRLVPSEENISTGPEVFGLAVTRYHQQMIGLAKDALTDVAPTERDISAVTIAIAANRVDDLKAEIQNFRRKLLELSNASIDADEIMQVNVQLFPIARRDPRSKRHE